MQNYVLYKFIVRIGPLHQDNKYTKNTPNKYLKKCYIALKVVIGS